MPPLAGAAIGALAAPALGGTVAAGIGAGAALGGALPSLFGGGGGASTQPAAQPVSTAQGQFQSYTPQAQQAQDYTFQGLQNELGNLAWSGLSSLPGGVTPTTQLYPQVANIAGTQAAPGSLAGSYGPYGDVALGKSLWSLGTLQDMYGGPNNLINYGQQAGAAGLSLLPQVQAAATNPQINQYVQEIAANPYNALAQQGALQGAQIGGQAAGLTPQQTQLLNALGLTLPGLGQQAAATSQAQIPLLQQLAGQSAGVGGGLAGQAQGLLPGLQQIGATGGTLTGAAPGFAQQALGTSAGLPQAQQQILQTGLDPQGALFNQLTAQTRDQANAINAMSGLAGTPYAAGLTNDAMRNFNINWQNQQLQRQAQADQAATGLANQQLAGITGAGNLLNQLTTGGANIGLNAAQQQLAALTGAGNIWNQGALGAGTLAGQAGGLGQQALTGQLQAAQGAGNLFAGGLNLGQTGAQLAGQAAALPAATYQSQVANALNALGAQSNLLGTGVNQLGALTSQLSAAGQQPLSALASINQLAAQPYNFAQTQGQNALQALQNQQTFGNQLLTQPQDVLTNALRYLTLGQNAAGLAGNLGQLAFAQNQQQLGNLGGLLQGGSNLLGGIGSIGGGTAGTGTGLLGNLFGAGGLFGSDLTAGQAGALSGFSDAFGAGAGPSFSLADLGALGA